MDHRELDYYNEVVNSADPDHQGRFRNQFTWELARHSVAEELIVYPAMEKYLGAEGKEISEKDRKEHHKVSSGSKSAGILSAKLCRSRNFSRSSKNLESTHPDYVAKLKELMGELSEHIKEEEMHGLLALEKALGQDENAGASENLAKNFTRTKMLFHRGIIRALARIRRSRLVC